VEYVTDQCSNDEEAVTKFNHIEEVSEELEKLVFESVKFNRTLEDSLKGFEDENRELER